MRRIMFLFLVFGLLACSPAERPADKSVASSGSDMSQESAAEPSGYIEYLWCTDGENYSVESVKAREEIWLEEVSQLGLNRMGSAEITPLGWSSENFDRVSVLFWENKVERDSGWEAYLSSGIEERLNQAYPGVESCGGDGWANVYPMNSYRLREREASDSFVVGYQFCNFNEGQGRDNLREFLAGPWSEFLDRYDSENPEISFGTAVNVPDFDDEGVERHEGVPDTFDYLWVNIWSNAAERDSGWSAVEEYGNTMMEAANIVSTCSEEQVWTGRSVKSRS